MTSQELRAPLTTSHTGAVGGPRRKPWQATPSAFTGLVLATPFVALAGALIVFPFVRLAIVSLGKPNGAGNYADFFNDSSSVHTLVVTCVDSLLVTALAVGLGMVLAWSLRTTRSRLMRAAILFAIVLPLWMGPVVQIYAFTLLFERFGVINRALDGIGIIDQPLSLLYTQGLVIAGITYQMLPFAVLPLYAVCGTIDLDLVRAAQGLGATRPRALASVVLPLALPGILAAAIIVYVITLGYYLTPVLLGGATSPFTATLVGRDIFQYYDVAQATVSSMLLLIVGLAVVGVGVALVGKRRLRRALG